MLLAKGGAFCSLVASSIPPCRCLSSRIRLVRLAARALRVAHRHPRRRHGVDDPDVRPAEADFRVTASGVIHTISRQQRSASVSPGPRSSKKSMAAILPSAPTSLKQHLQCHRHLAGRLSHRGAGRRDQTRRRHGRTSGRAESRGRHARSPLLCGRRARPTNRTLSLSPDVTARFTAPSLGRRCRRLFGADPRAHRRRRRRPAGRNDLRHPQRQGRPLAIEEVFAELGVRLPVMISVTITDASGARFRAKPSPPSTIPSATPGRFPSGSTARLGPARCGPTSKNSPASRVLRHLLPECRPAQRLWRLRRDAGRHGRGAR